jgi:hypothetical protein
MHTNVKAIWKLLGLKQNKIEAKSEKYTYVTL